MWRRKMCENENGKLKAGLVEGKWLNDAWKFKMTQEMVGKRLWFSQIG